MKHLFTGLMLSSLLMCSTSQGVEYDALVKAVTAVESAGNPLAVGLAGERGLMQIKSGTWNDMTRSAYGKPLPFDYAFHSKLNQRMGRHYLELIAATLQDRNLGNNKTFLSALIASYNLGPTAVARHNYRIRNLPHRTRDYVARVSNMYDYYLRAPSPVSAALALTATGVAPPVLMQDGLTLDESPEFPEFMQSIVARHGTSNPSSDPATTPADIWVQDPQRAGLTSLLPLFFLAATWSLYRAYLRSRHLDTWLDEVASSHDDAMNEFDFGPERPQFARA
jgi:hypothetical protein